MERLISVAETARLLGVSTDYVYALCARKELPHVRLGARVLIPADRLEAWITARIEPQPTYRPRYAPPTRRRKARDRPVDGMAPMIDEDTYRGDWIARRPRGRARRDSP